MCVGAIDPITKAMPYLTLAFLFSLISLLLHALLFVKKWDKRFLENSKIIFGVIATIFLIISIFLLTSVPKC